MSSIVTRHSPVAARGLDAVDDPAAACANGREGGLIAGGSSAFAQANELRRFWRDFNMAARRAIYRPDFGYGVYGAMHLGIIQTVVPPNLV